MSAGASFDLVTSMGLVGSVLCHAVDRNTFSVSVHSIDETHLDMATKVRVWRPMLRCWNFPSAVQKGTM